MTGAAAPLDNEPSASTRLGEPSGVVRVRPVSGFTLRLGVGAAGVLSRARSRGRVLDEVGFAGGCGGGGDELGVLEPADGVDDLRLGFLDGAAALRAEVVHLFPDRVGGAGGDIGEEPLLEGGGGAEEGERDVLVVDLAQRELEGAVVEAGEV